MRRSAARRVSSGAARRELHGQDLRTRRATYALRVAPDDLWPRHRPRRRRRRGRAGARVQVADQPRARARRARRRPSTITGALRARDTTADGARAARPRRRGRRTATVDGLGPRSPAPAVRAAPRTSTAAWPAPSCASSRRSRRWPTATSASTATRAPAAGRWAACSTRCAALGVDDRRRRPRHAAVHRARPRRGARRRGDDRRVGVVASSSAACCSPAPASTTGVEVRHVGAPVPSLPHIAMTRRDAARARRASVDDGDAARRLARAPGPLARAATSSVEPDLSNAAPFLAAAAGHRRIGARPRLAGRDHPGRATRCATCSRGWAPTSTLDAARPDRDAAPAGSHGLDADLRDVGELDPVLAALAALADDAVAAARHRPPARPRDRPARRAATEINGLGGDVDETARRAAIRPAAAARRRVRDLRRPPDGHRRRGARASPSPASRSRTSPPPRKTLPGFVDLWAAMLGETARRREPASAGASSTRTTSASARAARQSRPRTKDRPSHEDAAAGVVVTVDRGRYTAARSTSGDRAAACRRDEGARARAQGRRRRRPGRRSSATRRRRRTRWPASCGSSRGSRCCGAPPTTPTRSSASSSPTPTSSSIVTALADPEPRPRLIDRCLVAAYDAGSTRCWCLTKADLADRPTSCSRPTPPWTCRTS